MFKITKAKIAKLKPCEDRFDNYLKFYGEKDFTAKQFMGLRNISHSDKVWVSLRLMDKAKLRFVAADIAELVLPIFEKQYPNDNRPRLAIESARNGTKKEARKAVAAAYASASAADATYSATYSAAYAADAAAYAASADATYSAAYAAAAADYVGNKRVIEKKIRTIILRYL